MISFIGLTIFSIVLYLGIRYTGGKWKVSEQKKDKYETWVANRGVGIKKSIIRVAFIYYVFMMMQIYSQLQTV